MVAVNYSYFVNLLSASVPSQEAEPADGNFLSAEDGEEFSALSDGLSLMEVRERGNERLKEELAKAQRVGHTHTHTYTHTHTHSASVSDFTFITHVIQIFFVAYLLLFINLFVVAML